MAIRARWAFMGLVATVLGISLVPLVGGFTSEAAGTERWTVKRVGEATLECDRTRTRSSGRHWRSRRTCLPIRKVDLATPDGSITSIDLDATCLTSRPTPIPVGAAIQVDVHRNGLFGRNWNGFGYDNARLDACRIGTTPERRSVAAATYWQRLRQDTATCDAGATTTSSGLACSEIARTGRHMAHYYDRVLPTLRLPRTLPFPDDGHVELGDVDPQTAREDREHPSGRVEIVDATHAPGGKVVHLRRIDPKAYVAIEPHTVYLRQDGKAELTLPAGRRYRVTATSGTDWYGPGAHFGTGAPSADLGEIVVDSARPVRIDLGDPDAKATAIPIEKF